MTPLTGKEPCNCKSCGHIGELDSFDCGGLPDALVFCPRCLEILEVATGAIVADDDLELRMSEV